jgi:hypothetical protein
MWDQMTPDKADYVDFIIPGWMPDFYTDYFDNSMLMPIGFGLAAAYFPDKGEDGRNKDGDLICKWYNIIVHGVGANVRDLVIIGLWFSDDTVEPEVNQYWLYVDEQGNPHATPKEVTQKEWDEVVNAWSGLPPSTTGETLDPREKQAI